MISQEQKPREAKQNRSQGVPDHIHRRRKPVFTEAVACFVAFLDIKDAREKQTPSVFNVFRFFSADSDKFYTTFTPIEKTKKALPDR